MVRCGRHTSNICCKNVDAALARDERANGNLQGEPLARVEGSERLHHGMDQKLSCCAQFVKSLSGKVHGNNADDFASFFSHHGSTDSVEHCKAVRHMSANRMAR